LTAGKNTFGVDAEVTMDRLCGRRDRGLFERIDRRFDGTVYGTMPDNEPVDDEVEMGEVVSRLESSWSGGTSMTASLREGFDFGLSRREDVGGRGVEEATEEPKVLL